MERLVALEGWGAEQRVSSSRPAPGPSAKLTAAARLSSTTGEGLSLASAPFAVGDSIALSAEGFQRLADGFQAEIESRYS